MNEFQVIGTLPRKRSGAKFGDHAAYNGVYVGLIVDVMPDTDDATVAYRKSSGKVSESNFRLSSLSIAEPR